MAPLDSILPMYPWHISFSLLHSLSSPSHGRGILVRLSYSSRPIHSSPVIVIRNGLIVDPVLPSYPRTGINFDELLGVMFDTKVHAKCYTLTTESQARKRIGNPNSFSTQADCELACNCANGIQSGR